MRPVKVQPLQNPSVSSIKLHPLLRPQLCSIRLHPMLRPQLCSIRLHPTLRHQLCSIRLHPTLNAKTCTLFIKFIPLLSVADLPAGRQVMFLGHIFIDLTSKTSFQIGSECNIDTQPRPFSYFELTCFAHATPQVTDFARMEPRQLKLPIRLTATRKVYSMIKIMRSKKFYLCPPN